LELNKFTIHLKLFILSTSLHSETYSTLLRNYGIFFILIKDSVFYSFNTNYPFEAAAPIARLHYVKMNSNICITTDTYEFIWSNVHQTYTMERVIV
ncbi:hypothetical protein T03_18155, partial [Trichinella britovi]